jgi:hypothetical protein
VQRLWVSTRPTTSNVVNSCAKFAICLLIFPSPLYIATSHVAQNSLVTSQFPTGTPAISIRIPLALTFAAIHEHTGNSSGAVSLVNSMSLASRLRQAKCEVSWCMIMSMCAHSEQVLTRPRLWAPTSAAKVAAVTFSLRSLNRYCSIDSEAPPQIPGSETRARRSLHVMTWLMKQRKSDSETDSRARRMSHVLHSPTLSPLGLLGREMSSIGEYQ